MLLPETLILNVYQRFNENAMLQADSLRAKHNILRFALSLFSGITCAKTD
jgi:hypothetical protein